MNKSEDADFFDDCDEFNNLDPHQLVFCNEIAHCKKQMLKMPSLVEIQQYNEELSLFQKIAYYDSIQLKQKQESNPLLKSKGYGIIELLEQPKSFSKSEPYELSLKQAQQIEE